MYLAKIWIVSNLSAFQENPFPILLNTGLAIDDDRNRTNGPGIMTDLVGFLPTIQAQQIGFNHFHAQSLQLGKIIFDRPGGPGLVVAQGLPADASGVHDTDIQGASGFRRFAVL